jgi:hypothetical protein
MRSRERDELFAQALSLSISNSQIARGGNHVTQDTRHADRGCLKTATLSRSFTGYQGRIGLWFRFSILTIATLEN